MVVRPSNAVMDISSVEEVDSKSTSMNIKTSKWGVVKAASRRILPDTSQGQRKLGDLIHDLQNFSLEKDVDKEKDPSQKTYRHRIQLFRRRLAHILQQSIYHYIIIFLVMMDLLFVLVDLVLAQLSSHCLTEKEMEYYNTTEQRDTCLLEHSIHLKHAELSLFYISIVLLSIFVLEIFISFYALGSKYYKSPLYLVDGAIVCGSFIMEIYFHYGDIGSAERAASAIIVLRLWKIIRVIHAVAHSLTVKNQILIKKISEAKLLLEEEKEQIEQILEKQEIRLDYYVNILIGLKKLPSTDQIDKYVNDIWTQRQNSI